jgi:hypothetical protein
MFLYDWNKTRIANIQGATACVRHAAQHLPEVDAGASCGGHVCKRITRQTVLPQPPPALAAGAFTRIFLSNY